MGWKYVNPVRMDASIPIVKPIDIAGLACSGTTILLEFLARRPHFASHRYRDFPPVLTPGRWNWFVDRKVARRAYRPTATAFRSSPRTLKPSRGGSVGLKTHYFIFYLLSIYNVICFKL